MALDTLANVKARLGIAIATDDALIALLQDSADEAVENFCNRDLAGGTFTEYHPGGSEFVHLRNFPVDSVTSVKVDSARAFGPETALAVSDYVVHADRGIVQSVAGPFLAPARVGLVATDVHHWTRGPRVVQVVYSTLTGQVPADVKEAYARLVGHWYRRVKTDIASNFQDVMQQKIGETFSIFARQPHGLPEEVTNLLAPYRTPSL